MPGSDETIGLADMAVEELQKLDCGSSAKNPTMTGASRGLMGGQRRGEDWAGSILELQNSNMRLPWLVATLQPHQTI